MLKKLDIRFQMDDVIKQVLNLPFDKSLPLNQTTGTLFSGPYNTLPQYKNTPLGNILGALGPIGEARLLKLYAGQTYTAHTDPDDRFHLAITTNPYSYILNLETKEMIHIPVDGYVYNMDTSITHIAANFGGTTRVHLNIRHLLPEFQSPGYKLSFTGIDDHDWKQQLHINILGLINREIKKGTITGIAKISDREILINCDKSLINTFVEINERKGYKAIIENV